MRRKREGILVGVHRNSVTGQNDKLLHELLTCRVKNQNKPKSKTTACIKIAQSFYHFRY